MHVFGTCIKKRIFYTYHETLVSVVTDYNELIIEMPFTIFDYAACRNNLLHCNLFELEATKVKITSKTTGTSFLLAPLVPFRPTGISL
ncbi:MAG: hypothetical protein ACJA08_000561 [Cyclobacteriaceae bacterium]|jgi:hypothetical protein